MAGSSAQKPSKKKKSSQNQLNSENSNFNDNNSFVAGEERNKRKMDDTLTELQLNQQKFDYDLFELKDRYDESIKRIESLEETVAGLLDKLKQEEYKTSILLAYQSVSYESGCLKTRHRGGVKVVSAKFLPIGALDEHDSTCAGFP